MLGDHLLSDITHAVRLESLHHVLHKIRREPLLVDQILPLVLQERLGYRPQRLIVKLQTIFLLLKNSTVIKQNTCDFFV